MNPENAEEYTQSLGQIVAGSWRQIALAHRLGVPSALGYKKADGLRRWVEERLGGYIKMAITERKEAVAELSAEKDDDGKPAYSGREIAAIVGVDHSTLSKSGEFSPQSSKNANESDDHEDTTGENSPPKSEPEILDAIPAAQKTRRRAQRCTARQLSIAA
jgi:hypothetical protein